MAAYDASVRSRRWHTLLMVACVVAAMLLASISAEVSPVRFLENIHRFPSYIIRLFHLENGQPVWTDLGEWFWGLGRWLRLLWETLLMAYVGTLLGALAAACLAFLGAANVAPARWIRLVVRRFCELCRTVPELVFALTIRRRLRPRSHGGCAGGRHPHAGCARQAVRRGRREHRHEAGRGRGVDGRGLARGDALRRRCRRSCPTLPATRCCVSRSTCAAPPSWASSAPAASARI
jgi:hypothetical protein